MEKRHILRFILVTAIVALLGNFAHSQNVIQLKNGLNIYFTSIDTTGDYIEYTTDTLAKEKIKIRKKEVLSVINNRIITDYSKWTEMQETGNHEIIKNNNGEFKTIYSSKIVLDYGEVSSTFSFKKQGEYMRTFAEYSEAAYFKYRRGRNSLYNGRCFLVAGGSTFILGTIIGVSVKSKTTSKYILYSTIAATTALLEVGIPLVCVGKARIRKSFELYNIDYNKVHAQNDLSLNIGYTGTGLSLALNF